MQVIYIHAGLSKTGTTTFQRFLRLNSEKFAGAGYFTPAEGEWYGTRYGGHHSLPRQIEGEVGTASRRLNRRDRKWEDLLSDFERSGCHTMMISAEGFSRFRERELGVLMAMLKKYTVVPILTFRHPISHLTSMYCSLGSGKRKSSPQSYFKCRRNTKIHQYRYMIRAPRKMMRLT